MNKDEIIQKINSFLIKEFDAKPENIVSSAIMREALDLDSLDYVDLVVVIERTFGFKVSNQDFENVHTFDDFYQFVFQKINTKIE